MKDDKRSESPGPRHVDETRRVWLEVVLECFLESLTIGQVLVIGAALNEHQRSEFAEIYVHHVFGSRQREIDSGRLRLPKSAIN